MNKLVYMELLHDAITKYGEKNCLHIKRNGIYDTWTFNEFHQDVNKLAGYLKKHGLKKGTNAIVIGENIPEWVIAYHAIICTGACTVPVDPNIPSSEIESIAQTVQSKVVFCSSLYVKLFKKIQQDHGFIEKIICLDKCDEDRECFDHVLEHSRENKDFFLLEQFAQDDEMVIIFTSGTTGKAKGVVLCQKNFTAVSQYAITRMNLDYRDTVCAVLPLHHVFGFAACIAGPIVGGMDVVFVPYLKGPLILEALKDKKVTMLPAVPKMISLFYDSIMHNVKKKGPFVNGIFTTMKAFSAGVGDKLGDNFKKNLFKSVHDGFGGSLKLIISGGAALGKKQWSGFRQMGFNIVEGYGLSETFGPITVCPADKPKLASVGPCLPGNEIKIDTPNEDDLGEVLLRGTCVFKGYYNNDELTKEVIDADGWFHTGDLGKIDKDGYLYISGRKKDMIVLENGKNVYPEELEDFYSISEKIEEVGIFGIKQEETEIVAAVIVPSKDIRTAMTIQQATDLIYDELVKLGKELPVYRRITDFVITYQQLPRTTTKKLKKHDLKTFYHSIKRKTGHKAIQSEQLSVIELALMETLEYKGIIDTIHEIAPELDLRIVNPRSDLVLDFNFDSLLRIELLSNLERRFGIVIKENVFEKMETIADLVSLVKDSQNKETGTATEKVFSLKERILSESYDNVNLQESAPLLVKATAPVVQLVTSKLIGARATGIENFSSLHGPVLFASNHGNILDALWIMSILPEEWQKNTYFLEGTEGKKYPPFPYSFIQNRISLTNGNDPIEILKKSLSVIQQGKNLITFPEGVINEKKSLKPFKSGIGLLAKETGKQIIPIHIYNYEKVHPEIKFGKPFTYSDLINDKAITIDSNAEKIAAAIRGKIISEF